MREWWSRLRAQFRRHALDDDLRAELEAHLQMEAEANVDRGMSPPEALAQATRQFGNRTLIQEASREAWRFRWLDALLQDLRFGLRLLRRSRGFALTAIAVIAVGIGATTAAFTLLDHVLLRPLPFAGPEQLVTLYQSDLSRGIARTEASPPNFEDWRARSRSFRAMGAYIPSALPINLAGQGEPLRLDGIMASADVFRTLDVRAAAGRTFSADDERADAPDVVLLSDRVAVQLFGGAPDAVGRTLRLDGRPRTVVGVMPPDFAFPFRDTDLWVPLAGIDPRAWTARRNSILSVVARLHPGVSVDRARAEMDLIAAQLERAYPAENNGVRVLVLRLREQMSPQSRMLVLAVFGAACCVLLIACTNLASLLFARAVGRRQEMAVRLAIGAARGRLVRQLLTESVILALLGGVVGLLLAVIVTPSLTLMVPAALPIGAAPAIDWRMFAFAAGLTLATTVAFGVAPALRSSRTADLHALRVRSASGGRPDRLRTALVLAEIAGTVALLVGAGLLLKAMWRVQAVDPGFRADGVLTMRTALLPSTSDQARREFYARVLADARALPGVISAAYITFLPMTYSGGNHFVTLPGTTLDGDVRVHTRFVTPDYFETLRIPLVRGRDVADSDTVSAPRVTVISETLARRLWPGQDPIGRQMTLTRVDWRVVGIVGDVAVRGLERDSLPQAYFPANQIPDIGIFFYAPKDLVVRTSSDPIALVPALRRSIRRVMPDQAISDVRLLQDIVGKQTAPRREQLFVLGTFAGIAFLLAAIGVHGLLSFTVLARTQEIGVRVALGAARGTILRMFLRQGLTLGAAGVAIAVPLAYGGARGMQALLFGVEPGDPAIYASAALVAMTMALAGTLRPALHAATIDPASTIRMD